MNNKWITWRGAWALAGGLIAAGWSFSAMAQTAVESVTSSIQGGVEVVRIDFSQPLAAVPAGFSIQAPARVVLDIPGARNALGRSTQEINQGNIRSVNVVQSGDRARVVLNLKTSASYRAQLQGKSLLVVFDPVAATGQQFVAAAAKGERPDRQSRPDQHALDPPGRPPRGCALRHGRRRPGRGDRRDPRPARRR